MSIQTRHCQVPHCERPSAILIARVYLCEQHAEEVMNHLQRLGFTPTTFRGNVLDLVEPDGNGDDGPLQNAC